MSPPWIYAFARFSITASHKTQKTFRVAPLLYATIEGDESSLQIDARSIRTMSIALHLIALPLHSAKPSQEQELGI